MKNEMLAKTLETIVVEITVLQDRLKKLESIFIGPENDLSVDKPAAAAVATVEKTYPTNTGEVTVSIAEVKPLFEKPTAEEASRRAKKAWETRRARKSQPKTETAEFKLTFSDLVAAARK